jgi:hypothetical protein
VRLSTGRKLRLLMDDTVPKSLLASFAAAKAAGTYSGDLQSFLNVRYLLFRLKYADSNRQPPTKAVWLRNLLAYEKQCEEGDKST